MAAIVPIILAIISYFASKKSGADDATAAMVAAGAGLGSYYVLNETEWGKGVADDLDSAWNKLWGEDGEEVLNEDGSDVVAPKGSKVVYNNDGTVARDANGNVLVRMADTAGDVLTSWGATGTATVIGAGAIAANADEIPSWVWYAAGGLGLYMVLK